MLQDRRVVLDATVKMRLDMCRRMVAATTPDEFNRAHQLHKDAERIARKHGM
jgi:hypothetical protein